MKSIKTASFIANGYMACGFAADQALENNQINQRPNHQMNKHTPAIREALFNAVHGLPVTLDTAGATMKSIQGFTATSNAQDSALLGNFALKLLLDRVSTDLRSERESRMLVDKLRGN